MLPVIGCKTKITQADLKKDNLELSKKSFGGLKEDLNAADSLNLISSEIEQLNDKEKIKLINKFNLQDTDELKNIYSKSYIDSLKNILKEKKILKIDVSERFLVDHIKKQNSTDTVVMSYLNIRSPKNGEVVTYTYDVLAGDQIFYEITNGKSKLKNIEFLEGETVLLKLNDIKKRKVINGVFKINKDNKLILNISNEGFFRNKGLKNTNLKIVIKKLNKPKRVTSTTQNDTTFITKRVNKTITDTIYTLEDTKTIKLEPTINITERSSFSFPIIITSTDKLIGWGYWIGTTLNDFENYNNIKSDDDEPLISYGIQELKNLQSNISLPKYDGDDLEILILNQSLDSRSANFASNFAFYKTDNLIPRASKKAEVYITNRSSIYDYTINYRLITAMIVNKTENIEAKVPVFNKKIVIQLEEDD